MLSIEVIKAAREYHQKRDAKRLAQRESERLAWLALAREAILTLVPNFPAVERVYLFGSIVQSGRFRPDSAIDMAVECTDLTQESAFWRVLERTLQRDVNLRPYVDPIMWAVSVHGEVVYERKSDYPQ